jgi:hypothetical protein
MVSTVNLSATTLSDRGLKAWNDLISQTGTTVTLVAHAPRTYEISRDGVVLATVTGKTINVMDYLRTL